MLKPYLPTTFYVFTAIAQYGPGNIEPSVAQQANSSFQQCDGMAEGNSRLKCFEALIGPKNRGTDSNGASPWRLLKTKEPGGQSEITSIVRTADTLRSDLEIAGLMIRCSQTSEIEVLLALLQPLSLRSKPTVTIAQGATKVTWPGKIVAPGELVQLPADASLLANGSWQQIQELDITLNSNDFNAHGVVPLDGLSTGLMDLRSNCARR